jgi:transcriptional regulator with XRE-family HTH domain
MGNSDFWTRVKNLGKAVSISQGILSERINFPLDTLKGWIYYNRIPDAVTACEIAEVLGVTVEYLVTGKDGKINNKLMRRILEAKSAAARIKKLTKQIEALTEKMGI